MNVKINSGNVKAMDKLTSFLNLSNFFSFEQKTPKSCRSQPFHFHLTDYLNTSCEILFIFYLWLV